MNKNIERLLNNYALVKAAEETDLDMAVKLVSNPNLGGRDLSEVLNAAIMKDVISKTTGEPITLDKKVIGAGIRNRFLQIIKEQENKK